MEKKKVLRSVTIEAQFPELKGGACNQRGRGVGGTVKSAFARAVADLLKQPKLKRKRFSTLTAIVSVGQIVEVEDDQEVQA